MVTWKQAGAVRVRLGNGTLAAVDEIAAVDGTGRNAVINYLLTDRLEAVADGSSLPNGRGAPGDAAIVEVRLTRANAALAVECAERLDIPAEEVIAMCLDDSFGSSRVDGAEADAPRFRWTDRRRREAVRVYGRMSESSRLVMNRLAEVNGCCPWEVVADALRPMSELSRIRYA